MFRINCPVLAAAALLVAATWAQDTLPAYQSPGKDFSFELPAGWRVAADGAKLRISSPEGAIYVLVKNAQVAAVKGDPAVSTELRAAAETVAKPLLQGISYAGVKPIAVDSGAGAVYRFRGKGAKS